MSRCIQAFRLTFHAILWVWRTALFGNSVHTRTLNLYFTRCMSCDERYSRPDMLYCQRCLRLLQERERESTEALKHGVDYHENYHEAKTEEQLRVQAIADYGFSGCQYFDLIDYVESWISGYHSVSIGACKQCHRVTRVHEIADMLLCERCMTPYVHSFSLET